jgi:hypothetical protein
MDNVITQPRNVTSSRMKRMHMIKSNRTKVITTISMVIPIIETTVTIITTMVTITTAMVGTKTAVMEAMKTIKYQQVTIVIAPVEKQ